jgi:hypothetical protein
MSKSKTVTVRQTGSPIGRPKPDQRQTLKLAWALAKVSAASK